MTTISRKINKITYGKNIPLNVSFELTPYCNMHCKMCYIHQPDFLNNCILKPMSFWLNIAEQAKELGTMTLVITGGETFLYPHVEELLEKLMRMGFIISLNTNGTLLDERRLEWLDVHRPTKINISLYGASNETYNKLCGVSDGFTRVSTAIDELLARGHNVYINGTLNPENIQDIPAMVDFCKKRGLVLHGTSYLFPPGRYGCHTMESRLAPKEAAQAQLLLECLQEGANVQLQKCLQRIQLVDATLKGHVKPRGGFHIGEGCNGSGCSGGRNSFAISHDGRMMMCVTNAGISIPLDEMSLEDAWKQLDSAVENLQLPGDCEMCPFQLLCNACPAMLYNETGEFGRLSEYACSYMKENYFARVEILKQHAEKMK